MSCEAKIEKGTLRPQEKLFFFANKHLQHKLHSCLGTTSYNTYPLPSLNTFTTQSFSVWRQGQLKRLRFKLANIGTFYPAIIFVSDTLKSILKRVPFSQTRASTVALFSSYFPTVLHYCIWVGHRYLKRVLRSLCSISGRMLGSRTGLLGLICIPAAKFKGQIFRHCKRVDILERFSPVLFHQLQTQIGF